jgi:hypothetical protein
MRRVVVLLLLAAPACTGREAAAPAPIDLVALFDRADKRPPRAFAVRDTTFGDLTLSGIVAVVPSRITWQVRIPRRAVLRTAFGIEPAAWKDLRDGVVFRLGISDRRTYETLLSQRLEAPAWRDDRAWRRVSVDLSRYAGWQWSLFYHPSATKWEIIFSIDGSPAPGMDRVEAVWGAPAIEVVR